MDFPPVQVNNTSLGVEIKTTSNRNAYARVRNGSIVISIPTFMRPDSASRVATDLYNRIKKSIIRRPEMYLYDDREIPFNDGDVVNIMGRAFRFSILCANRKNSSGRLYDDKIRIIMPDALDSRERARAISRITRRILFKELKGNVESRVMAINQQYFRSNIENVRIINASTRWGSCTTSRRFHGARISINFKLLFMPQECIEYVMVHELAHTKLHNHSKAFWRIVEGILPNYKEQKRTLRLNAYQLKLARSGAAAQSPSLN